MQSQFNNIRVELHNLIQIWENKLHGLSEDIITERRNSQNRNIKQIVGHMADSATNNIHRIVHLQYGENPNHYPDYANLGNNDKWIAIQNYEDEDWDILVELWKYTNFHFTWVMTQINPEKLENIWISAIDQKISLKDMVVDFPRHLKLHLSEIEDLLNQE